MLENTKIEKLKKKIADLSKEIILLESKNLYLTKRENSLGNRLDEILAEMVSLEKKKIAATEITGKNRELALKRRIIQLKNKQKEFEKKKEMVNHIKKKELRIRRELGLIEGNIQSAAKELYLINETRKKAKKEHEKAKKALEKAKKHAEKKKLGKKPVKLKPVEKKPAKKAKPKPIPKPAAKPKAVPKAKPKEKIVPEEEIETAAEEEKQGKKPFFEKVEKEEEVGEKEPEEETEAEKEPEIEKDEFFKEPEERTTKFGGPDISFIYPDWLETSEITENAFVSVSNGKILFEATKTQSTQPTIKELISETINKINMKPGSELLMKEEQDHSAILTYSELRKGKKCLVEELFIMHKGNIFKLAFSGPPEESKKIKDYFASTSNSLELL